MQIRGVEISSSRDKIEKLKLNRLVASNDSAGDDGYGNDAGDDGRDDGQ